jgi:hypothetical protein
MVSTVTVRVAATAENKCLLKPNAPLPSRAGRLVRSLLSWLVRWYRSLIWRRLAERCCWLAR